MSGASVHGCKLERVSEESGLEGVDERLVGEWKAGKSVRTLMREFNEDVIDSHLAAADVNPVEWEHAPIYEALHTEELSDSERIEVRRGLERAGIDVDALESSLVSHQTVYRHLTDCLGASAERELTPEERRETARDTVYSLQRRTELVTSSTVENLKNADLIQVRDPDVVVDVQVLCRECGRAMDVEQTLTETCNCDWDESNASQ